MIERSLCSNNKELSTTAINSARIKKNCRSYRRFSFARQLGQEMQLHLETRQTFHGTNL
jgi:hypothetical protein